MGLFNRISSQESYISVKKRSFNIIKKFLSRPYTWCFTTYFAEGFPYTLIRMVSPLFLRTMNVSLESIGLTSFFSLPWILKFLWAPQVDQYGTKRKWLLIMQLLLAQVFIVIGFLTIAGHGLSAIAVLLLIGAFLAATHDTAIDGYYLSALDKDGQSRYVGYRVMAYRIAMMTGTGLITTIGVRVSWFSAFLTAGGLLGLLYIFHHFFLPKCETEKHQFRELLPGMLKSGFLPGAIIIGITIGLLYKGLHTDYYKELQEQFPPLSGIGFAGWISIFLLLSLAVLALMRDRITETLTRNSDSFYAQAFSSFINRPHIGIILTFVIFLRTGEFFLSAMVAPFIVDLGVKMHYGWIQAAVGLPASIVGAMVGGYCISRWKLKNMLFPFLFAQNGSNIVYMLLAFSLQKYITINTGNAAPEPIGTTNIAMVAFVQGIDQFAGGLGTSVLMTFLMRICTGTFKSAHYAIGSGLMSVSGLFTGVASGFIAARFGYGWFFGISFLISAPGMFLAFPAMKVLPKEGDTTSAAG